jgi:hypothetical protein
MNTPNEHRFEIEQGFADDGWTACCSCGWSEPEQRSRLRALDAWENHCDVVFIEATMGSGGHNE